MRAKAVLVVLLSILVLSPFAVAAQPVTLAVMDFDAEPIKQLGTHPGSLLAELLSSRLSRNERVRLIERGRLDRILEEQALGSSGFVDPGSVTRMGELAGVQVLITGRAFALAGKLILTARLVETATGHLKAVTREGRLADGPVQLVNSLAEGILEALHDRDNRLSAGESEPVPTREMIDPSRAGLPLPRTAVCTFERILDAEADNSVGAGEVKSLLLGAEFEIVEIDNACASLQKLSGQSTAALEPIQESVDVLIIGEVVGRFALRTGELVSSSGSVHLSAHSTSSGRLLASNEREEKSVDVTPANAAEKAIRKAARHAAAPFIPACVKAWHEER